MAPGSRQDNEDQVRLFKDVLDALPKIDGWKPGSLPWDLNSICQSRLDAKEAGEISSEITVEEEIEAPGREIAEYRHRLNRKRRQLIRSAMSDLILGADESVRALAGTIPTEPNPRRGSNLMYGKY